MTIKRFVCLLIVLTAPVVTTAQESKSISIAVDVATKAGQPAIGLDQHDFTVLENKTQRPITSFKAVSTADEPVHVILMVDAVNLPFTAVSYAREGIEKYLKSNEGKLTYPTTIAIVGDKGAQIAPGFSSDGNALNDVLQKQVIGLREINRTSEWGASERLQISLEAFEQLAGLATGIPGRKVVVWISSGWPLISGPGVIISSREEERLFNNVVSFSNQLRQENLTIYNVNPWGVGEPLSRADYYESFLKAPVNANNVSFGAMSLQVLAIHSGGLVDNSSDVEGSIEKCLNDLHSWYRITFEPLPADKPNEYHHIEVRLDQRGLTARTTDGYYANPTVLQP